MNLTPEITAKLASRICHDLISPVGAVVNGVDLIAEIGGADVKDELAMISQSAGRASSLLQFHRIAFGIADAEASVAQSDLASRAAALFVTPRVGFEWPDPHGPALPRPAARMLCQMMLCGRALLGMRGRIVVSAPGTGPAPYAVQLSGDAVAEARDLIQTLNTGAGADALDPRQIEFALVRASAAEVGLTLAATGAGGEMAIRAVPG